MKSFKFEPSNRRQVYLALASQIEGQLRDAYACRHDAHGETQSSLAKKLGVDRSAVNRRLTGRTNMTIETIADMVWALGHCIQVDIFDPDAKCTNHRQVKPANPRVEVLANRHEVYRREGQSQTEANARASGSWLKIESEKRNNCVNTIGVTSANAPSSEALYQV